MPIEFKLAILKKPRRRMQLNINANFALDIKAQKSSKLMAENNMKKRNLLSTNKV